MNTSPAHDPAKNYGAETWRAPTIKNGEVVRLDEPGRVYQFTNYAVTYQSYYLRVVGLEFGGMELRVRHGAGEERYRLGTLDKRAVEALNKLDSDDRYSVLFTMYDAIKKAVSNAAADTSKEYRTAFVQGRLKKRKGRGQDSVKVWVEPAVTAGVHG